MEVISLIIFISVIYGYCFYSKRDYNNEEFEYNKSVNIGKRRK